MRNNKNRITTVFLAAGLLTGVAVKAGAQDPASDVTVPLTIAATATYQLDDITSDTSPITKHVTKTVKWTTKGLLSLISSNLNTTFPNGSKLVLVGGSAAVQDKQGNQIGDASSILSVDTSGAYINNGQDNSDTGASSSTVTAYVTITFDDGNGNAFTLTGLGKSASSATAGTDKNGNSLTVKEAYSISFSGVGYGTVGGADAVFTGTASGTGKATQSSP